MVSHYGGRCFPYFSEYFWKTQTFLPCGILCFPITGYEVSANTFYSTKIQTVSLFVIAEYQKPL